MKRRKQGLSGMDEVELAIAIEGVSVERFEKKKDKYQ